MIIIGAIAILIVILIIGLLEQTDGLYLKNRDLKSDEEWDEFCRQNKLEHLLGKNTIRNRFRHYGLLSEFESKKRVHPIQQK